VSHLLPYLLFVAVGVIAAELPADLRVWADPLRAAAAAAALLWFARRGAYAELAVRATPFLGGGSASGARARALAVASGLAVAAMWMPLADVVPSLGARGGFQAGAAGPESAWLLWTARLAGSCVVVPFAEELFVRSALPRWIDDPDAWRTKPVGVFTMRAAAVSVVFFAGTHPEWLSALVAGLLWTWLLATTRRLSDVVLAHAVANTALAAWVVTTGETRWW
jgi:CAAX prenyl protease-like protein